ncbi:MAG TPA: peptidoglycan-binding domain-containing protein [Myxococcota bacterium]|nr:peptidoglycan-binding domain-containing protein [Myxococcota bacterium]
MPIYQVGKGESATSIAAQNGFFVDTVWNHARNTALREKRKTPDQLFDGDEIFIPNKELKQEDSSTGSRHRFKVKGVPAKFRLQLLALGEPRANEDYVLNIDGQLTSGKTDAQGWIKQSIPPGARSGTLLLQGGKETIPIQIGDLDPIEEVSGVQQRLTNLGFPAGNSRQFDDPTKAALKRFQAMQGLPITGEADDATRAKLKQIHD